MTTRIIITSSEIDEQSLSIGLGGVALEIEELLGQEINDSFFSYDRKGRSIEITLNVPGTISSDKIKEILNNNIPNIVAWSKELL